MNRWKLEREEYHFKIYDEGNSLAAYFQPDYGEIYPKEKEEEIIEQMLKRQDEIHGGLIYLPMAKLNLPFDADYDLEYLLQNFSESLKRISRWKECLRELPGVTLVRATRSHSDPDMLALLLGTKFPKPVRLSSEDIHNALQPILDTFAQKGLL